MWLWLGAARRPEFVMVSHLAFSRLGGMDLLVLDVISNGRLAGRVWRHALA
jgi:hypothetical protein